MNSSTEQLPLNHSGKPNGPFFPLVISHMRRTFVCMCVAVVGIFGPKAYLVPSPDEISSRPIPYQVIAGEVLLDFRYNQPYLKPTISSSFLVTTGVWVPLVIIGLVGLCSFRRNNSIMLENTLKITRSFLVTIGMSECITNILKFWVHRPRPNFYQHCGFDVSQKACMGGFHEIVESQLSFPSGHTSLSFSSTTILLLFFWNHVFTSSERQQQQQPVLLKLLAFLLLWGWSTFVSVTRIVDFWHHPSDVLAGFLLGTTCAVATYHSFFV